MRRTVGCVPVSSYSLTSGRTVFGLVEDGARAHPGRELVVFGAATWTWQDALERIVATARFLIERGVGPGDRIHLHLTNRPDFLFLWFAAARIGASIVPTNPLSSADEVAYITGHARTKLSISDADLPLPEPTAGHELPPPPTDETRELAVMYTSGTTSRPKGVIVTHAAYIYAGEVTARAIALRGDDRFLVVLPLFHGNAQYYCAMSTLVAGGTLILGASFSASGYFDLAARHRATVGSLFAAPIRMILAKRPTPAWKDNDLRLVLFAQKLSGGELAEWDEWTAAPLVQLYGMTETVGPPLMNPLESGRRDSIGRPTLGYEIRIVDGELQIKGEPGRTIMAGYLDDPEATAATIQDGWLRTGDVVRRDADGFVRFVDRRKDMIKRAGENVAAGEVEAVLLDHPGVRDVAVVGVPDPMRDEQIVAYVVAADGHPPAAEELIAHCARHLARFRVPSHVRQVDELPRTSVGKIRKVALREAWLAEGHKEERGP
jgi:carnitine-CoA ligase